MNEDRSVYKTERRETCVCAAITSLLYIKQRRSGVNMSENTSYSHKAYHKKSYKEAKNTYQYRYCIQLGLFRTYERAFHYQLQLYLAGYRVDIDREGELYTVNIGDFNEFEDAIIMERILRIRGFNTVLLAV